MGERLFLEQKENTIQNGAHWTIHNGSLGVAAVPWKEENKKNIPRPIKVNKEL